MVDPEVVKSKLIKLEEYIQELQEYENIELEEYKNDEMKKRYLENPAAGPGIYPGYR